MGQIETHHLRETPQDLANELAILSGLASYLGAEYQKIPSNSGKYKIDAWLAKRDGGFARQRIIAFVECKWLTREGFYGVNLSKWDEAMRLLERTGVPFLYAVRVQGRAGYIKWSAEKMPPVKCSLCGGTPKGRPANWDDIEPMMMFRGDDFHWFSDSEVFN